MVTVAIANLYTVYTVQYSCSHFLPLHLSDVQHPDVLDVAVVGALAPEGDESLVEEGQLAGGIDQAAAGVEAAWSRPRLVEGVGLKRPRPAL